jgi:hypothetical protein
LPDIEKQTDAEIKLNSPDFAGSVVTGSLLYDHLFGGNVPLDIGGAVEMQDPVDDEFSDDVAHNHCLVGIDFPFDAPGFAQNELLVAENIPHYYSIQADIFGGLELSFYFRIFRHHAIENIARISVSSGWSRFAPWSCIYCYGHG